MAVFAAQGLGKSFGTRRVLEDISFSIEAGERVALVGLNGSGKSTLARIVAGVDAPDEGSVARGKGVEIGYLSQDPTFDPEASAREVTLAGLRAWTEAKARYDAASSAIVSGAPAVESALHAQADAAAALERLGGWDRMHQVEAVLGHVGVRDHDAAMGTLSGGDRRRVALAALLVARPAFAILDEPTNHLDTETIAWLEGYLVDEFPAAILLITHDRYLLDRVVTRTLEIDHGKLYSYEGGYEAYLDAKAQRLALEERTERNRQNFLRRELEWLRRQPKARTGKQKARIDRALAAQAAPQPKGERAARLAIESSASANTVLELRGLSLAVGGRVLVRSLDLFVARGERVGIVGPNGIGKTTLLRSIVGEVAPEAGEVVLGKRTHVAYFEQLRATLDPALSVFDNVAAGRSRIDFGGTSIEVRSYLERFLFDGYQQRQPVGSLSGGERARVALARMLSRGAGLVLLDEPTNDLDVSMLAALEEMLLAFDGAALVVTHDRWFLDRVATSLLVFEGDGRVVRHAGNYQEYRDRRADEAEESKAPERAVAAERPRSAKAPPKKRLTHAEQRELETLLERIEAAERRVGELERTLSDPAFYAERGAEVAGLVADLEGARGDAARLYARWEELEAKKAG